MDGSGIGAAGFRQPDSSRGIRLGAFRMALAVETVGGRDVVDADRAERVAQFVDFGAEIGREVDYFRHPAPGRPAVDGVQVHAQFDMLAGVERRDDGAHAVGRQLLAGQQAVDLGQGAQHRQLGHALLLGAVEQVLVQEIDADRFRIGGQAASLIAINLVLNFAYNGAGGNISIGAHIGGLIGGILVTLAFANWGRGHAAYGKVGLIGGAGVLAVTAASIAIAYWKVRGLA